MPNAKLLLTVSHPNAEGKALPISIERFYIGRPVKTLYERGVCRLPVEVCVYDDEGGYAQSLEVAEPLVSRRHLLVEYLGNGVMRLTDHGPWGSGSTYGTTVFAGAGRRSLRGESIVVKGPVTALLAGVLLVNIMPVEKGGIMTDETIVWSPQGFNQVTVVEAEDVEVRLRRVELKSRDALEAFLNKLANIIEDFYESLSAACTTNIEVAHRRIAALHYYLKLAMEKFRESVESLASDDIAEKLVESYEKLIETLANATAELEVAPNTATCQETAGRIRSFLNNLKAFISALHHLGA